MSGSFFAQLIEKLPTKRATQIMVILGVLGLLGISTSFILFLYPPQEMENGQMVFSVTPIPAAQTETGNATVVLEEDEKPPALDTRVSVNTASSKELEELPYIGEKKASNIQASRPYSSIDDFFAKNPFSAEQTKKLKEMIKL